MGSGHNHGLDHVRVREHVQEASPEAILDPCGMGCQVVQPQPGGQADFSSFNEALHGGDAMVMVVGQLPAPVGYGP